ncbi:MAG: hypothetical protein WCX17_02960 [Parcubacteria group bacterium]
MNSFVNKTEKIFHRRRNALEKPLYHIAVRRDKKIGFVLIERTDSGYVGNPKWFSREDMLVEYAKLVTEFGGKNVVVSEVKFFFLTGHVEEVSSESRLPWMKGGTFEYIEPQKKSR